MCVGVSACLLNLIPQIKHSLDEELDLGKNKDRPSLFVFDIQDYQIDELKELLSKNNYSLQNTSPLIRGRIVAINGKDFKRDDDKYFSREDQSAKRIKNRTLNLSFRKAPSSSETIIEGKYPSESYDFDSGKPIEVSLETRYAGRLGVGVGDSIDLEVQGLPFKTKVTSIRKVKWTSFQPNFFIQVQDGAINDAPKIYISSLRVESEEQRRAVQSLIGKNFSNISTIDVSMILAQLKDLLRKMSLILLIMVGLVSLSGLLVILAISYQQFLSRRRDIKLMKLIGSSRWTIVALPVIESLCLSATANVLGVVVGLATSYVLAVYVFEGVWSIDYLAMVYVCLGLPLVCVMTSFILSYFESARKADNLEL